MNLDPTITAALVAGVVSAVIGIISYFSNRANVAAVRHEVEQSQFQEVIAERIKLYPNLWRIHIQYETNWMLEKEPKTREWAQQYFAALNEFNLEGGLFFSQDLYLKFHELRSQLYEAIDETEFHGIVDPDRAQAIRKAVYGEGGDPGLSTHLKDDLGSYKSVTLQRRRGGL